MAFLGADRLSEAEKEQFKENIRQQMAIANVQDMLMKLSEICFKKCIDVPGKSLYSSEEKCIAFCMDRYLESLQIISRSYENRLKRENKMI